MHPDLPAALLTQERNKVRVRSEDRHWDYKEKLSLTDPYAVAEFAKDEAADSSLQAADFLFFAEALFAFGGHSTEKEACQNVSMGIQRGAKPSMPAWTTFVECSIKRSDFKPLASMVSSLDDMDMLALVFDRLGKLLVGTAGHTHVDEWASALNRMLTSPHLEAEKKSYYRDLVTENRALSARLKLNS